MLLDNVGRVCPDLQLTCIRLMILLQQMGVGPKGKLLTFTSAIQIVFRLCYVATSYACPEKCYCKQMGSMGFIVKCKGIMQVPRGLPVKTLTLWVQRSVTYFFHSSLWTAMLINLYFLNLFIGHHVFQNRTKRFQRLSRSCPNWSRRLFPDRHITFPDMFSSTASAWPDSYKCHWK